MATKFHDSCYQARIVMIPLEHMAMSSFLTCSI
jgi:hypothetical protein